MTALVEPKACSCGLPMLSHAGAWLCKVCDEPWRVE